MMHHKRDLYIGIDIHSREHKAALVPIALLEGPGAAWRKVKPLSIKNDIGDFERLDTAIRSHIFSTEEVAIAVDHTGGHYKEGLDENLILSRSQGDKP